MRHGLLSKVVVKLVSCYILSSIIYLIFCIVPSVTQLAGVLILLVSFGYTCYVLNSCIFKPLHELIDAIRPIDFGLDKIDFTVLDNFSYKDNDEIKVLETKFKDLAEVLVVRVDRVNSETYKSEHDGLSGLYNRVKYQRMKDVYSGCNNLCIIYIDVNNLKKMNDIFGHEAGDALIQKAAKKLNWWEDIADCYRMGGDEFMVVIMNKSRKECEELIDTWYPTVGCLNRKSDGFKCFMAYGVSFGGLYSDVDALIKEADEKMYSHKIQIKLENGEDLNSR